jgi:hypothetical protein
MAKRKYFRQYLFKAKFFHAEIGRFGIIFHVFPMHCKIFQMCQKVHQIVYFREINVRITNSSFAIVRLNGLPPIQKSHCEVFQSIASFS